MGGSDYGETKPATIGWYSETEYGYGFAGGSTRLAASAFAGGYGSTSEDAYSDATDSDGSLTGSRSTSRSATGYASGFRSWQ